MLLALLGRVGNKRRIELLHLAAAAFRAGHLVGFMLFQRQDHQRFLPAVQTFIVVHGHSVSPFLHSSLPGDDGWNPDRRGLRALLALFKVEGDVGSVSQFSERKTLQGMFVKIDLASALLENEPVPFYWE